MRQDLAFALGEGKKDQLAVIVSKSQRKLVVKGEFSSD